MTLENEISLDALLPSEMAVKAEQVGVRKAKMGPRRTFYLALLAGAFIALGAVFATTVSASPGSLGFGPARFLAGFVFSLGLILVVVAGAELFTGNSLIIMAWASRKITTRMLLRNWVIVYIGNFVGAVAMALLIFISGQYQFGEGVIGLQALNIATGKVGLGFVQAIALGVVCNLLVCLAVWLTLSSRTTTDRILAVIFPITAFVAAGFEHSVANMYFIPMGIFIKSWAPAVFWQMAGSSPELYASLTWPDFFLNNLLPVTLGNVIGGAGLVGFTYWVIYLRRNHQE